MPRTRYRPQPLSATGGDGGGGSAATAPRLALGCELLTPYGRGRLVAVAPLHAAPDGAARKGAAAGDDQPHRLTIRLVSWQLAARPVTLEDLLREEEDDAVAAAAAGWGPASATVPFFATIYATAGLEPVAPLSAAAPPTWALAAEAGSLPTLTVLRPPLEAGEYPTPAERSLRLQERRLFALELMQRRKEAADPARGGARHRRRDRDEGDSDYALALASLDEALQLARTLLYDQRPRGAKDAAASAGPEEEDADAPAVNVPRALLILTTVQCCNHASACALQLRQWQGAVSHAMMALTLLQKMQEAKKQTQRQGRRRAATATGDIRLFGLVRVQSLKRVARAMVALRQKATAVQLLESALDTCRHYLCSSPSSSDGGGKAEAMAKKKKKNKTKSQTNDVAIEYAPRDLERLRRQQAIVQRMLDRLVPPSPHQAPGDRVRGLSLIVGQVPEHGDRRGHQPFVIPPDDDNNVSLGDEDSILSMSSESEGWDNDNDERNQTAPVLAVTTSNADTTPSTRMPPPAPVTPDGDAMAEYHQKLQEQANRRQAVIKIQSLTRACIARRSMEQERENKKRESASTSIQAHVRGMLAREQFGKLLRESAQTTAALKIQRTYYQFVARKEYVAKRDAALKIQTASRRVTQQKKYQKQVKAAKGLQTSLRCTLALRELTRRKAAVTSIQAATRAAVQRKIAAVESNSAARVIQKSWRGVIVRRELAEREGIEWPTLRKITPRAKELPPTPSMPAVRRYTDFWKEKEAKAGYKAISVTDWQMSPAALVAKEVKFANVSSPVVYSGEMHVACRQSMPADVGSLPPSKPTDDWTASIDTSKPGNSFAGLKALHESWSNSFSGETDRSKLRSVPVNVFKQSKDGTSQIVEELTKTQESEANGHSVLSFEPEAKEGNSGEAGGCEPLHAAAFSKDAQVHNDLTELVAKADGNEQATVACIPQTVPGILDQTLDSVGASFLPSEPVNTPYSNETQATMVVSVNENDAQVKTAENDGSATSSANPHENETSIPSRTVPDDSWRTKLQARVVSSKHPSSSSVASYSSKHANDSWRDNLKARVGSTDVSLASHGSSGSKPIHAEDSDEWRGKLIARVSNMSANGDAPSVASRNSANLKQKQTAEAADEDISTSEPQDKDKKWFKKTSLKKAAIAGMGVASKIIAPKR